MSSIPLAILAPLAFLGPYEMMIVGFVALLLFYKCLPSIARSLGQSLTEFKKGVKVIEDEVENTGEK